MRKFVGFLIIGIMVFAFSGCNHNDNKQVATSAPSSAQPTITPTKAPTKEELQAEQYYKNGYNLYNEGKYDEAIALMDKALELDNKSYKAMNVKGIALCFKKQYVKGMSLIDSALTLKPDYGYANFNKAMAYKLQKDYDNSVVWFEKAIAIDGKDVWSYYGLSTIYADRQQTDKALLYLEKATMLDESVKAVARLQSHFEGLRNNSEFKRITAEKKTPILYYHSINEKPMDIEALSVKPEEFDKQMKYLKDNGFTPIDFSELNNIGKIEKPIIITFDDGYKDNYTNMYPILKKYNFKATVFMIADAIDTDNFLSKDDIKKMSNLVSFQNHTVHHVELNTVDLKTVEKEMVDANSILKAVTGKEVRVMCYPVGKYNTGVKNVAKKYFDYAVTIDSGVYTNEVDKYAIGRVYIKRAYGIDDFVSKLNKSFAI